MFVLVNKENYINKSLIFETFQRFVKTQINLSFCFCPFAVVIISKCPLLSDVCFHSDAFIVIVSLNDITNSWPVSQPPAPDLWAHSAAATEFSQAAPVTYSNNNDKVVIK